MTANEQDLRALAYLAKRLRSETHGAAKWDDAGLWSVLKKLEGHNLALTIERVTRHAADPEARTPAAIERPFVPDAPKAGQKYPLRAGDPNECPLHPGQHRDHCGSCHADQLVGDVPHQKRQPRGHTPPNEAWKVARQELDLRHALTPSIDHEEDADA